MRPGFAPAYFDPHNRVMNAEKPRREPQIRIQEKQRELFSDGAEDSPEHVIEPDSALGWAKQVAEQEDRGLD
jgi:hypothetical protein